MKLTDDQQKELIEKLNLIWKNKICDVCSEKSWNINDTIFELREFQGGGMVIGGNSSIQPLISMTCNNCGNTKFLNAIKLGITNPQEPQKEVKEGGKK